MESKPFKVIVAGGSVSGLALANMLEQAGIDYVVLEKHEQIAPNLGASIAIAPNGSRILDQLGCFDALNGQIKPHEHIKHSTMHAVGGKQVTAVSDITQHLIRRHGYGFVFFDREQLIKALFDNIKDKSRILTQQAVDHVEHLPGGVRVTTKAGSSFDGHIVVGADGVHSAVRKEMWRLADAEAPGYFDIKERNVSTTWAGIFGVSKAIPGISSDALSFSHGEGHSYFVAPATNERLFWFIFVQIPEVRGLYERMPRYTDKDRDELAAKHLDDQIREDITFKMLWDRRIDSFMTPLTEYCMSKWHYRRITTLGDAVAKQNPIGGQGGNSALETAAVLTNLLYKALKEQPQGSLPDDKTLAKVFEQTTATRIARLKLSIDVARTRQQMEARTTFAGRIASKYLLPYMNGETFIRIMSTSWLSSHRLEMLEVPLRDHSETYLDERLAQTFKFRIPFLAVAGVLLSIMLSALKWAPMPNVWLNPDVISNIPLGTLVKLLPVWFGSDVARIHAAYTLIASFPLAVVAATESCRHVNRGGLSSLWFVLATLGNIRGLAIAAPLYYIANVKSTGADLSVGLGLPTPVARSISAVTQAVFAIAVLLVFAPFTIHLQFINALIPLWTIAPCFISGALFLLDRKHRPKSSTGFEIYQRDDAPYTRKALATAAGIGFVIYAGAIAAAAYSIERNNAWAQIILYNVPFVKADLIYTAIATILFSAYHVFELRRKGLVKSAEAIGAIALLLPANIVMGPGAALAALWWFREGRLVSASKVVRVYDGVLKKNK